ncbi:hypothetical protein OIU84_018225 [Salix udensis]|uniref:Histidine kinase domain-containing protein n=1 Tax=Salix udensis TaxID=889485 RepID=A0AAD6PLU0_9ROSI|nr:hypothetical protein OIU84_018225 [Salix udensis]
MACCRLKNQEAFVNLGVVLNTAMTGQESEKVSFGFLCSDWKLASQELQQALHVQRLSEQTALKSSKALAYIKKQVQNPLSGIIFSGKMMEETELGAEQKELLHTSAQCQCQLSKILNDSDLDSIIEGYLDLEMVEFTLREVLVASISQVMMKSNEKGIRIINDAAEETMAETLYGDSIRLQQTSWGQSVYLMHLELRIRHPGAGIPEALLDQMFGGGTDGSVEGIGLVISRKLVKLMNGDVRYMREAGRSSFIISVELAGGHKSQKRA